MKRIRKDVLTCPSVLGTSENWTCAFSDASNSNLSTLTCTFFLPVTLINILYHLPLTEETGQNVLPLFNMTGTVRRLPVGQLNLLIISLIQNTPKINWASLYLYYYHRVSSSVCAVYFLSYDKITISQTTSNSTCQAVEHRVIYCVRQQVNSQFLKTNRNKMNNDLSDYDKV